jgi:hypothetical protein
MRASGDVPYARLVADVHWRAMARDVLASNLRAVGPSTHPVETVTYANDELTQLLDEANRRDGTALTAEDVRRVRLLTPGDERVEFRVPEVLARPWQLLLRERPVPAQASITAVKQHIRRLADAILDGTLTLQNQGILNLFRRYATLIGTGNTAANQGIVVAGARADDVRIANNSVSGALQGIHVGTSGRDTAAPRAQCVLITGNAVETLLSAEAWGEERHGIYVGNTDSAVIENNHVSARRRAIALFLSVDGIRAYGDFGPRLLIRQNHTLRFNVGVRARALNVSAAASSLWRVYDNALVGGVTSIHPPMP